MKNHSAKKLRQMKAELSALRAEHKHLVDTLHRDDCLIFIVAGKIKRLEGELRAKGGAE